MTQWLLGPGVVVAIAGIVATAIVTVRGQDRADATALAAQHADTYARAVEQLGSTTPDVRIGGIHALAALARGAPDYVDPVCDLLHTFVVSRNKPATNDRSNTPGFDLITALQGVSDQQECPDRSRRFSGLNLRHVSYPELRARRLSLIAADLSEADLSEANLSEANLSLATLSEANLSEADLARANLTRATLSEASLTAANLTRATLVRADLSRAILTGATLSGADLSAAYLSGTDLTGATLSGADLSEADLTAADLTGADLHLAAFDGAKYDAGTRWPKGFTPPSSAVCLC